MTDLFLKLLDLSLSANWVILAVIAVRLVLKKAPKWMNCAMWALVAVRLLCPFTLESGLRLVPKADPLPEEIQAIIENPEPGEIVAAYAEPSYSDEDGQAEPGKSYLYMAVPAYDGSTKVVGPVSGENNLGLWLSIAPVLWLCGMVSMFSSILPAGEISMPPRII